MLSGADLNKILDDDFGDAGFNDPVPQDSKAEKPSRTPPARAAPAQTILETSAAAKPLPKPYERPAVSGASPPPPAGTDLANHEISMAIDEAARAKGYKSAEEYNQYLEQSGALEQPKNEDVQEMLLAPGIKKAPAYMPPGAYPGDKTKLGKDYEKEQPALLPPLEKQPPQSDLKISYVKQSDKHDFTRANDGHTIRFRIGDDAMERRAEMGGAALPWALEEAARKMKVGDVADVAGRGEHAFADADEFAAGAEKTWRFELLAIEGHPCDKFNLNVDERIDRANELRLRGNDMFKQKRMKRALHYYEKGSALMDVLEAEELGLPGKSDSKAAERNRRVWQCQKPLLLNWALILMKLERWQEAERKCTEVLMDIDKLNVKALFRRGQCNVNLGNHTQAHSDLSRAAELDTSIATEVEREMVKVRKMQRVEDRDDEGVAKKVVKGLLQDGDERSEAPPPREDAAGPSPTERLMGMLQAQEAAADTSDTDHDTYCRQREAIYNQFLNVSSES